MRLTAPSFWYKPPGLWTSPLAVLSCLYGAGQYLRESAARPYKAAIPVICIGNIVAGGSGKTPAALAVMQAVRNSFSKSPCFLTRGYGGRHKGPLMVDTSTHTAHDVGDEPLLLARRAPVIISADREKGARYAEQKRFDLLVMDDGMQNPRLHKDIVFVVIDGATGFGNGRLLPAGPLREPASSGLRKADAFILIGDDKNSVRSQLPAGKPVFAAMLEIADNWSMASTGYVAFCGIAHPQKFRQTLAKAGVNIEAFHPFPDHWRYTAADLEKLAADATARNARLITTEKDAVRLPSGFAADVLPVELRFEDHEALVAFLKNKLAAWGYETDPIFS